MADIDIVLERLVNDAEFRAALADDPAAALSGYDLSEQDLQLLAGSLDDGDDAQRGVEQRTSKSAMVGLLASLTGGGGRDVQDDVARVRNAAGTTDPTPASKYSSPINVVRAAGAPPAGADPAADSKISFTFQKIEMESRDRVAGSGSPDEVAKVREAAARTGSIILPPEQEPLDGAVPVAGQDARLGGEDARLESTRTAPPGAAGSPGEDARHHFKIPNRVDEQAPPVGDFDGDGIERAAAPIDDDSDGDIVADRTAAPVPADYDGDGFVGKASDGKKHFEVTAGRVASDDDFLTVEDE